MVIVSFKNGKSYWYTGAVELETVGNDLIVRARTVHYPDQLAIGMDGMPDCLSSEHIADIQSVDLKNPAPLE
jgi:hypothetical protein